MDMIEALKNLHVGKDTLATVEKSFLDENGYLILENVMTDKQVQAFSRRLDELAAEEGDDAGK